MNTTINAFNGGVTSAKGFKASGIHCGLRKNKGKYDLACIFASHRCPTAAVYTTNRVFSSPITVTRENLADGMAQAVICNSGNANTCNGDGYETASQMGELLAEGLGIDKKDIVVASTGVIGVPLPIEPIKNGIPALVAALGDDEKAETDAATAAEYGFDTALLAGDALHSASVYYLSRLSDSGFVPPKVTLKILKLLEGEYGPRLISGETLDTKNGLIYGKSRFFDRSEEEVLFMMAGKTGALFAISALSGALIGAKNADETAEECAALARFAENCGLAFQLQDDILGVISTEEKLGKPIGSDIREGKPTLLLLTAYKNATEEEKVFLRRTVGVSNDEQEILRAGDILRARGVEETRARAAAFLEEAKKNLDLLPDSPWKELLEAWRSFMLNREM